MDMNTIVHSQFGLVSMEEESLFRIKKEFQTTISGIQSAMMLAISNYDKKCNDYSSLLKLLDAERDKTKLLEQQMEEFKKSLEQKDELIAKLQLHKDASIRNEEERAIGQSNGREEKPNQIKKKPCDFELKLQSILKSYETLSVNKNTSECIERQTKSNGQKCKVNHCLKRENSNLNQDAIQSKPYQNPKSKFCNQTEFRDKIGRSMKNSSKNYLTVELHRIIGENRAIIDGLKKVQQT